MASSSQFDPGAPPARGGVPEARPLTLFGISLAGNFDFSTKLLPAAGPSDLEFELVARLPAVGRLELLYGRGPDMERFDLSVYRFEGGFQFQYSGIATFNLQRARISCSLHDPRYRYAIEIYLLGPVLAFWLEWQGMPALHASAVQIGGRAVAFLSSNRGGKSSLAAALMQQGRPLITDDILAVEPSVRGFRARPGYPQMRMWPAQAENFAGSPEKFEPVDPNLSKLRVPVGGDGFGTFCPETLGLGCIYVPQRSEDISSVQVTPLPFAEAFIELVRHSFLPDVVDRVGFRVDRFAVLSELGRQVPVRRLSYPNGLDRLPMVAESILHDIGGLAE